MLQGSAEAQVNTIRVGMRMGIGRREEKERWRRVMVARRSRKDEEEREEERDEERDEEMDEGEGEEEDRRLMSDISVLLFEMRTKSIERQPESGLKLYTINSCAVEQYDAWMETVEAAALCAQGKKTNKQTKSQKSSQHLVCIHRSDLLRVRVLLLFVAVYCVNTSDQCYTIVSALFLSSALSLSLSHPRLFF